MLPAIASVAGGFGSATSSRKLFSACSPAFVIAAQGAQHFRERCQEASILQSLPLPYFVHARFIKLSLAPNKGDAAAAVKQYFASCARCVVAPLASSITIRASSGFDTAIATVARCPYSRTRIAAATRAVEAGGPAD